MLELNKRFLTAVFLFFILVSQCSVPMPSGAASNLLSSIEWREPWVHVPYTKFFAYKSFVPHRFGFEITVSKSRANFCQYGIQVISDSYVDLEPGRYLISCKAYSSKRGKIYFNIQTDNAGNPNFVLGPDKRWLIDSAQNHGNFVELNHSFTVQKQAIGLLHFKIGEIPTGAILKVEDIRLEKIE